MNTDTGEIRQSNDPFFDSIPRAERAKWIPVQRDLTARESHEKQISLYAPCACGSGKKFKFCCKTN